jgi:hypothetical protein
MTVDPFRRGTVLSYPYEWQHSQIESPKDRPVCVAIHMLDRNGKTVLALAAISDQKGSAPHGSIELTSEDMKNAGLKTSRRAYVHLGEVNVDRPTNMLNFPPGMRVWGRLTEQTLYRITEQLVENLKAKTVVVINREK